MKDELFIYSLQCLPVVVYGGPIFHSKSCNVFEGDDE